MRVVLDTNVFISGIFWSGECNEIIMKWKEGKFILVTSLEIISELVKVLDSFKIQLPKERIKEWANMIIRNSIITEPKEKFNIIKDDPKDDLFVETAFSGKAYYLVTYDNHLLKLKEFKDIKIITPAEFLKLL